MSLIYDYLKIEGKNGSERDADIEIPPALKRRDDNRLNTRSLLLIIGSCLAGVLFIFLVFRIFSPGQDEQVAVVSEPVTQARPDQAAPDSATPGPVAMQAAEKPTPQQEPPQEIQVFPEPERTLIPEVNVSRQIAESSAGPHGPIRKKLVQPLELQSSARKITFPDNAPVYTEPEAPAAETAAVKPPARLYSPSPADQAVLEKGKKFYQAALQAQYKGDSRIAEIYYNKVLEVAPGHMDAMVNLSALFVQQERYHEAEDMLAEILAREPANSKALVNLGVISLYKGDDDLAAAQFEAALAANPLEENALVNLVYLTERNRDYAAAERYYRQLLQISPENLEVLLAYGHLLEEQQRYPEAMALYGDIRELAAVKKDRQLYNRISERIRLLAGVVKK